MHNRVLKLLDLSMCDCIFTITKFFHYLPCSFRVLDLCSNKRNENKVKLLFIAVIMFLILSSTYCHCIYLEIYHTLPDMLLNLEANIKVCQN